jgi:hypothetical protein
MNLAMYDRKTKENDKNGIERNYPLSIYFSMEVGDLSNSKPVSSDKKNQLLLLNYPYSYEDEKVWNP